MPTTGKEVIIQLKNIDKSKQAVEEEEATVEETKYKFTETYPYGELTIQGFLMIF